MRLKAKLHDKQVQRDQAQEPPERAIEEERPEGEEKPTIKTKTDLNDRFRQKLRTNLDKAGQSRSGQAPTRRGGPRL